MKQTTIWAIPMAMILACATTYGYSNPIEGGSTETVTNDWNVPLPWLMVGSNSGSNTLEVVDGGVVNSQIGYLGNTASSTHNQAIVSGSGVWNNAIELSVGYQGVSNSLTVAAGGTVATPNAYIGNNSDGNQATVTGNGSVLSASTLNVGYQGSSNGLLVTDGGTVESDSGTIGYWIGSDGNIATVQSNGTWNSSSEINVGEYGSGNQLVVGAGGSIDTPVVNVGVQSIASNNAVTVTGDGALLDTPELYIGGSAGGAGGTGNRIEVENGGTVATTDLHIYSGNSFDLNDGGRLVVNTNFNVSMSGFRFNNGGTLEVGGELTGMNTSIEGQRSLVLNGASAEWDVGGSSIRVGNTTGGNSFVITNGGSAYSGTSYIGYGSPSSDNTAIVSGTGSLWRTSGRLTVGYQGDNNSLLIENAGQIRVRDIEVGSGSQSSGNHIMISGDGSMLTTSGGSGVVVGTDGSDNKIEIADGAAVRTTGGIGYAVLGYSSGSTNNTMRVDDATVQLMQNMYVGLGGAANSLVVTNGGMLTGEGCSIGRAATADGNSAIVSGLGSLLSINESFTVGSEGASNLLVVANGGQVLSATGRIGRLSTSDGNRATVTGEGSKWDNSGDLFVGDEGLGNQLLVSDAGQVENQTGYIGYASGADSNAVVVSGDGSVWQNHEGLYLGGHHDGTNWVDGGTGNSLTVEDGNWMLHEDSSWVLVGDVDTNNLPNRYMGSRGGIAVGDASSGAEMVVANGSLVDSGYTYIGLGSSETGSVLITGSNTVWNNSRSFYVGYAGSSNTLTIADGARVESFEGAIGSGVGADNNSVLIAGAGSIWDTTNSGSGRVKIGWRSSGNTLTIAEGGRLTSQYSTIGSASGSGSNSVLVAGAGSVWDNMTPDRMTIPVRALEVGDHSSGNSLTVLDGGSVYTYLLGIGNGSGSSNNAVTVSGAGSLLNAEGNVTVGYASDGNELTVSDGARLEFGEDLRVGFRGRHNTMSIFDGGSVGNKNGFIGYGSGADSNTVVVSGEGSVWQSQEGLYLGGHYEGANWMDGGTGNSLTVTNDGVVRVGDGDYRLPDIATPEAGLTFIVVGDASGEAEMVVANGSLVQGDYTSYIGFGSNDVGSVLVTGSNSVWRGNVSTLVGSAGSGNRLTVANGARDEAGYLFLGNEVGSDSNQVFVTGFNTVLNSDDLHVGYQGSDNNLTVTDGGVVESADAFIGRAAGADSNTVVVSDNGSVWQNHGGLYLGGRYQGTSWIDGGVGNSLTVTNGGRVLVGEVDADALDGLASSGGVVVGDTTGAQMVVANGSLIDSENAWIGLGANDQGSVRVSGDGTVWDNNGLLHIGYDGSGNTLRIEDGGVVSSYSGIVIGEGAGADNNQVVVSGEGSTLSSGWHVQAITLPIIQPVLTNMTPVIGLPPFTTYSTTSGSASFESGATVTVGYIGSGNTLDIVNGGIVSEEGLLILDRASFSNSVAVVGGGSIWTGGDGLVVSNGLYSGAHALTNYSIANAPYFPGIINGNGRLVVGREGSNNSLLIEDGAQVFSVGGVIGQESNAWNNTVSVIGTNSAWRNISELSLGGQMELHFSLSDSQELQGEVVWIDGGRGNLLYVADGGLVSVGANMHNRNYSTVNLDPGGRVSIGGNYYQDATSLLRFGVETNAAGAPLTALMTVGGIAAFDKGAQIEYASNVGELQFDTFYTNKLVEADQLIVAGVTNASSLDLEQLDASGSLVDVLFAVEDQDIIALAGRRHLTDVAGFSGDSMMSRLADEIDDMSLLGDHNAVDMIYLLNTMTADEQNQQMTQQYAYSAPSYLHVQGMTEGLRSIGKQVSRKGGAIPRGASGPHAPDQGPRGWIKPYHGRSDRAQVDVFSGYEQNIYGTLVGMDWTRGNFLVGVAGGYGRSVILQDNDDRSEAKTGFGAGYLSMGTDAWYGDMAIAIGRSSIEDMSGSTFGSHADYDATSYALQLNGGNEWRLLNGLLYVTPQASMLLSYYRQEDYTESSGGGVERDVASYERFSAVAGIGAAVAVEKHLENTVVRPEVRYRWLHELNTGTETANFSLVGGQGGQYEFQMPGAEENLLEIGTGLSCSFNDELTLAVDLDWRAGHDYEAHTISGRMVYEF